MTKKCKFSIIMVVKNAMPNIVNSIKSYNSQNYKNKELLIIHSPSNDGTNEYVIKLKKKYRIFFDKKSKNKFGSLNLGLKKARGNYIGLLHAGDYFKTNNTLKSIYNFLYKKDYDLIYGNCLFINSQKKIIRRWHSNIINKKKIKFGWMPPHTTLFIKKKLKNMKYPTKYKISGDYYYIVKLFKIAKKIGYLNKFISIMNYGGDSTNLRNFFLKLKEDYQISKLYFKNPLINLCFKILGKVKQFI
jgi:glycosyltransferase involved in cell wall biosynthesis